MKRCSLRRAERERERSCEAIMLLPGRRDDLDPLVTQVSLAASLIHCSHTAADEGTMAAEAQIGW